MQNMNRRDLVKIVGGAGVGAVAALISQTGKASAATTPTGSSSMAAVPWPYKALVSGGGGAAGLRGLLER